LEVSVYVSGYPTLFQGEWELRLNDICGAKLTFQPVAPKNLQRFSGAAGRRPQAALAAHGKFV
jgi:hypothetical protein